MFFWNSFTFFHDPADVCNLISGSSAFSQTSLNIRKFMVHILLKPGLENFEHYFTSMWNECNCAVVWAFFGIASLWDWMKTDLFQSCGHCWLFQICWHIECSTFTASSLRIWNSSTRIPSPPLALFIVMLSNVGLVAPWHVRPTQSRDWISVSIQPTWLHIPRCLALGQSVNTWNPLYFPAQDLISNQKSFSEDYKCQLWSSTEGNKVKDHS